MIEPTESVLLDFYAKVNTAGSIPDQASEHYKGLGMCHEWIGHKTSAKAPYGRFKQRYLAHRYSWFLLNGPIPKGMMVLHRCDNSLCVNPAHLFLGTALENNRDRESKMRGAQPKGEKHWTALYPEKIQRGKDHIYRRCPEKIPRGYKKKPESIQKGSDHPMAKITENQVREIRSLFKQKVRQRKIAELFGLTQSAISLIVRNKKWNHVQ